MIIENGTIEFKEKTPGGIDPKTGHAIKATKAAWSGPIPCQYIPNSRSSLGRVKGERYTTASYTVLIEEQPLPDSEQIRLADRSGRDMGQFSLLAPPELLEAVGEIRLMI